MRRAGALRGRVGVFQGAGIVANASLGLVKPAI
jgi:hypothetical protein